MLRCAVAHLLPLRRPEPSLGSHRLCVPFLLSPVGSLSSRADLFPWSFADYLYPETANRTLESLTHLFDGSPLNSQMERNFHIAQTTGSRVIEHLAKHTESWEEKAATRNLEDV